MISAVIAKNKYEMSLIPEKYTHRQLAINYTRQALFGSGWKAAEEFCGWKLDLKYRRESFLKADSYSGDKYHGIRSEPGGELIVEITGKGEITFSKRELSTEIIKEIKQPKLF